LAKTEAKGTIYPCGKPQGLPWPSLGRLAKKGNGVAEQWHNKEKK